MMDAKEVLYPVTLRGWINLKPIMNYRLRGASTPELAERLLPKFPY